MVPFKGVKIAPHIYQLNLVSPLAPGEYGIIPPRALNSSNLASAGKLYTFSILE